jgi:hypothetical protein
MLLVQMRLANLQALKAQLPEPPAPALLEQLNADHTGADDN